MKKLVCALTAAAATMLASGRAQTLKPKPAFPGRPKPRRRRSLAAADCPDRGGGLTGAWSLAFLPDGNFLVTQNVGTMRIVRPDGVVSAPIDGVPAVKSVAAQGLHDVVLDPTSREIVSSTSPTLRRRKAKPRRRGRLSTSTSTSGPGHSPSAGRCNLAQSGSPGRD